MFRFLCSVFSVQVSAGKVEGTGGTVKNALSADTIPGLRTVDPGIKPNEYGLFHQEILPEH